MPTRGTFARGDNKGLTVKINLWSLEKHVNDNEFSTRRARLWIRGAITNAETKDVAMFNDPGQLLSILSEWNADKFRALRSKQGAKAK
jgi:hypothetical protein